MTQRPGHSTDFKDGLNLIQILLVHFCAVVAVAFMYLIVVFPVTAANPVEKITPELSKSWEIRSKNVSEWLLVGVKTRDGAFPVL